MDQMRKSLTSWVYYRCLEIVYFYNYLNEISQCTSTSSRGVSRSTSMPKVFISYSPADAPVAMLIADILRGEGVEIFEDRDVLVGGNQYEHKIDSAIREADAVVVLL